MEDSGSSRNEVDVPQIGGVRARWRRALARSVPLVALALVATLFLHGWWNGDLPATPRLEL
ncbi:MAG: CPBP family intramembrane glutamic endopeptidase, partial [Anaerolineae bacterium]